MAVGTENREGALLRSFCRAFDASDNGDGPHEA